MRRYLGTFLLAASFLAPTALLAQNHDHQWNDNENTYWHQYLKEHHKKDHDWNKASKREREDYWKWRDAHPDAH